MTEEPGKSHNEMTGPGMPSGHASQAVVAWIAIPLLIVVILPAVLTVCYNAADTAIP